MDEAIRDVLACDLRVGYALVFGSSARTDSTPFSDLDIAIGLNADAVLDHRSIGVLTADLERRTGRVVDVILVEDAPAALAYRIFRDGRLLLEADRGARIRAQTLAVLKYLDFKPFEQQCARAVLDAVARG
jgi:predicted nucleotidyltransferase